MRVLCYEDAVGMVERQMRTKTGCRKGTSFRAGAGWKRGTEVSAPGIPRYSVDSPLRRARDKLDVIDSR